MANEPTLRRDDQGVDGWVEYLQTQLKLLGGGIIDIPDSYQPNGVFDEATEHYVRAFQQYNHIMADGVVGDETWNMLHGNADDRDPHTDGRDPHTYVESTPRLEWENDGHYDLASDSYTYMAMNVGSTPIEGVVATVQVTLGTVGLRADHCIGWTDNEQPAEPGQPLKFTFWLERPLTRDEDVGVELALPDENGGARFEPILSGYLQAYARGENLDE
jgi:Putative peptidoglycan binding domain